MLARTRADPEIELTVAKLEKNIENGVVGSSSGLPRPSVLDALQSNRPTKNVCGPQARNWGKFPGGAKPAYARKFGEAKALFNI